MAKTTTNNKAHKDDEEVDFEIASGTDPFNGLVYLFYDSTGYWIENWRTDHYSDYLQDDAGNLIDDEAEAMKCFNAEISNAQWVGAIYP